jgi:hypothetical protein
MKRIRMNEENSNEENSNEENSNEENLNEENSNEENSPHHQRYPSKKNFYFFSRLLTNIGDGEFS